MNIIGKVLHPGQQYICSLGATVGTGDDMGYDVYYVASQTNRASTEYRPLMVDGNPVRLIPATPQVILTLPGSYQFRPRGLECPEVHGLEIDNANIRK